MALAEDLSQFFEIDDFAVEAVITLSNNTQKTVKVIFDKIPTTSILEDTAIVSDGPKFIAATADLNGVKEHNQALIGGKTYKVAEVSDDGTGISTVYLKK